MSRWGFPVTHAAKSTDLAKSDLAKSAIDAVPTVVSTDITQPTDMTMHARTTPVPRKSGVERYFRKARDRALREARSTHAGVAPEAATQGDPAGASTSASQADAIRQALQVAENEGWKYRDCVQRNSPDR